ncbi:MAG TPA: c-type cytochrome [Thermoanaerobaculia bacterium]|nr:c-type cytochrome [Thermoanaerobaculia bacterium]
MPQRPLLRSVALVPAALAPAAFLRLALVCSAAVSLALAPAAAGSSAQTPERTSAEAPADAAAAGVAPDRVERGRYLVHHVAMCVQCHSPRDRRGELLEQRLLEGGPVPVESPYTGPRWAFMAPHLKRVPGYTEEEFVRLLRIGLTRNETRPLAPMPPFRMTEEDARAIWSYLRSLGPIS